MKEIIGSRITLRKAKIEDTEDIFKNVYSDFNVTSMMFIPPSTSLSEAYDRVRRTIEFQKDKDLFFVELNSTKEVIGIAGYRKEKEGIYSEAGIGIGSSFQGNGYGSEILELLMSICFNELDANVFRYYSFSINEKSKSLARKYHFIYEDSKEEIRAHDNKKFIVERYKKTKEDYINDCRRIKR